MKLIELLKKITPIEFWALRKRSGMPVFIEARLPEQAYGREVLGDDYTDKNGDHDDIREADFTYVHHAAVNLPKLLEAAKMFANAYNTKAFPTMSGPIGIECGQLLQAIHDAEEIKPI